MVEIFKSTLTVMILSALGALGAYMFHLNFIAAFLILFVIQYILFSFFANIVNTFFREKTKQKMLDSLEPLSTILECAYCNFKNIVTFYPNDNERIEMECESCKKKNLISMQFVVARITEPVNVETTTLPLIDEKDKE
jgi:transcription elongation factor Elf1